jgi:hypothetical protein
MTNHPSPTQSPALPSPPASCLPCTMFEPKKNFCQGTRYMVPDPQYPNVQSPEYVKAGIVKPRNPAPPSRVSNTDS